jgi:hypothetical protein
VAAREETLEDLLLRQIQAQLHSAGLYSLSATLLRDCGYREEARNCEEQATEAWSRALEADALLVWLDGRHPR